MSKFDINLIVKQPKEMRYPTLGDWYDVIKSPDGFNNFLVEVADTKNIDYNFLIALHELIEYYLCFRRKIKDKTVTGFDMKHLDSDDPGRLKEAPYHKEHKFAEKIERIVAKELKVSWSKYWEVQDKTFAKI